MDLHILTLYPEMFYPLMEGTIFKRAQEKGLFQLRLYPISNYAMDKHRSVDHKPFGGGPGMLLRYDVLYQAWKAAQENIHQEQSKPSIHTILPSPRGRVFTQKDAQRFLSLGKKTSLLFVCGRFEGVDERFVEECVDEEISLGDFILSGGELATLAILDASLRLIPQCLGNEYSNQIESFSSGLENGLEYPQYAPPRNFRNRKVPEVLLSGNHKKIEEWRNKESRRVTQQYRPDLFKEKEE